MKLTQKIFLILILGSHSLLFSAIKNKDEALRTITSLHNLLFGKENVIIGRIDITKDRPQWYHMMIEIKNLIGSSRSKNKDQLTRDFTIIEKASNEVLGLLHLNYNTNVMHAIAATKQVEGLSKIDAKDINFNELDINKIETLLEPLKTQKSNLIKVQDSIKEYVATLGKKTKENVKDKEIADVLNHLAIHLEITIDKIFKDIARLKAEAIKFKNGMAAKA